jgi:hypothetical protein
MENRVEIARLVSAAVAAIAWLWFVSHGFQADGILDAYYELQAQALLQGRLSIGPGPFDLFIHDAAIRGGRCYSIYGFFPSILFIAAKPLLGRFLAHYAIVLGFFFSLAYFLQKLIAAVIEASGAFESEPRFLVYLSSIVLGCSVLFFIPLPGLETWFFGRFIIYEQQAVFSLALAVPGTYYLVRAVQSRRVDVFTLAAVLFSLASWNKITWFGLAVLCTVAALYLALSDRWPSPEGSARIMTAVGLTVCFGLATAELLKNWAQFGSALDFGTFLADPSSADYLRNQVPLFSPLTRVGNAAFMMISFYGSPKLATLPGVWDNSFALWEDMAPCFFATNPWFLPVAVLIPVGLFSSWKRRSAMFPVLLTVFAVTLYINAVFAVFGLAVTKRYFVEVYHFLVVLLFGTLLVFVRLRYAVVILLVFLGIRGQTTIRGFQSIEPEIRVIDAQQEYRILSVSESTPFLVRNGTWPKEFLSGTNLSYAARCAVMGVQPQGRGQISAMDVCAVYLSLESAPDTDIPARVNVKGAASIPTRGTWLFFVDEKLIGSMPLNAQTEVDASFELPHALKRQGPYRVLGVFVPEGTRYLPGRSSEEPVVTFREIALESSEGTVPDAPSE